MEMGLLGLSCCRDRVELVEEALKGVEKRLEGALLERLKGVERGLQESREDAEDGLRRSELPPSCQRRC